MTFKYFTFPTINCTDERGEYKLLLFNKGDESGWPQVVREYVLENAICHVCAKPIYKKFQACRCSVTRPNDFREYRLANWNETIEAVVVKELQRTARRNYPSKSRGKANRKSRMDNIIGGYNDDEVIWLMNLQNGCCYYCGSANNQLQLDHMTPVSRGGTQWISNLVWSCVSCNTSKCDKTEAEFWQYLRKRRPPEWYAEHREKAKQIRHLRKCKNTK